MYGQNVYYYGLWVMGRADARISVITLYLNGAFATAFSFSSRDFQHRSWFQVTNYFL